MNLRPTDRQIPWIIASLWLAVLISSAGAVYVKHTARNLFIGLEKLTAERDNLNIEWGRLQLEQSAWSTHGFVEQVADRQLKMALPNATDVKIVQP
jgi:cell division protein FtsL